MASRKRMHHCKDSNEERGRKHDDEKAYKDKSHQLQLFRYACLYTERFCSILLSSITTGRISSPSRVSLMSSPQPRRSHQSQLKCLIIPIFLCSVIPWLSWNHRHYPGHESFPSLKRVPPLVVKLMQTFEQHDTDSSQQNAYQSHWKKPDYYNLHIESLQVPAIFEPLIDENYDYERNEEHRRKMLKLHKGGPSEHFEEYVDLECRKQNWQDLYFPNCNSFHEFNVGRRNDPHNLAYYNSFPISNGAYRDAWILRRVLSWNETESSVLKILRYKRDYGQTSIKGIQTDAIVMERLTSSPRIIDIFGHCGTSTIVEPMQFEVIDAVIPGEGRIEQKELDKFDDVHPMNNFTIEEKLQMAIDMAEAIADLHGYQGGVIVHDDIKLKQWMMHPNKRAKLGDFNRAEIMDWNEEKQAYCSYANGEVYGIHRSPEEMRDDWLSEKIDVYSFGNLVYELLTGLWVFYENSDDEVVQDNVIAGKRAFIDDRYRHRSYIDGKLIELIEKCWIEDPRKRIDIFEAVRFLRTTLEENNKQGRRWIS